MPSHGRGSPTGSGTPNKQHDTEQKTVGRDILVFCDSTERHGGRGQADQLSNVYRLYQLAQKPPRNGRVRLSLYVPNIGATLDSQKPLYLAQLFDTTIVDTIATTYMFISRNYRPDDHIYLFGYSRGAFVVQKLAFVLYRFGLEVEDIRALLERLKNPETRVVWNAAPFMSIGRNISIKCMVLWETVGTMFRKELGSLENNLFGIPDSELPPSIEHALHALAFHENRRMFRANLFEHNGRTKLKQVWFPGTHEDMGGGGASTPGLAEISLLWVISEMAGFIKIRHEQLHFPDLSAISLIDAYSSMNPESRVLDDCETRLTSGLLTSDSLLHESIAYIHHVPPSGLGPQKRKSRVLSVDDLRAVQWDISACIVPLTPLESLKRSDTVIRRMLQAQILSPKSTRKPSNSTVASSLSRRASRRSNSSRHSVTPRQSNRESSRRSNTPSKATPPLPEVRASSSHSNGAASIVEEGDEDGSLREAAGSTSVEYNTSPSSLQVSTPRQMTEPSAPSSTPSKTASPPQEVGETNSVTAKTISIIDELEGHDPLPELVGSTSAEYNTISSVFGSSDLSPRTKQDQIPPSRNFNLDDDHRRSTMSEPKVLIGIIGGSGLYNLENLTPVITYNPETPWGLPSSPITISELPGGTRLAFLARHGTAHNILPSDVPARANIAALKSIGVKVIVAFSAVGSLREEIAPGDFIIPNQIIDRTKGIRPASFFEGTSVVAHAMFGDPFDTQLTSALVPMVEKALGALPASTKAPKLHTGKCVVCMEGPQFSTRAESHMYRAWGGDIINMSVLPEAKLAREAELSYALIATATDYDSWRVSETPVTVAEVFKTLTENADRSRKVTATILEELHELVETGSTLTNAEGGMKFSMVTREWPEADRKKLAYVLPTYFG